MPVTVGTPFTGTVLSASTLIVTRARLVVVVTSTPSTVVMATVPVSTVVIVVPISSSAVMVAAVMRLRRLVGVRVRLRGRGKRFRRLAGAVILPDRSRRHGVCVVLVAPILLGRRRR